MASGLAHKSEKGQVSIFVYAMGDCADDILATLSIDEETVSFADIKTAEQLLWRQAQCCGGTSLLHQKGAKTVRSY